MPDARCKISHAVLPPCAMRSHNRSGTGYLLHRRPALPLYLRDSRPASRMARTYPPAPSWDCGVFLVQRKSSPDRSSAGSTGKAASLTVACIRNSIGAIFKRTAARAGIANINEIAGHSAHSGVIPARPVKKQLQRGSKRSVQPMIRSSSRTAWSASYLSSRFFASFRVRSSCSHNWRFSSTAARY